MQQRWNPEIDFGLTYYLSGPMSGIPEYNYPAFEEAARILRQTGLRIESPHENPVPPQQMSEADLWTHMMELCIDQMERCGGIILLKGWPQSRGSRQELQIAMQKDWPVWFYNDYQLTNMNRSAA